MERLNSIFRLGLKELVSLARDAAMVGLIIYAFTYAVFGPAKGAQMELRNAAVAVVDEDRSPLSARIVDALLPAVLQAAASDRAGRDRCGDGRRPLHLRDRHSARASRPTWKPVAIPPSSSTWMPPP